MAVPKTKSRQAGHPPTIIARLESWTRVESHADGSIVAVFDSGPLNLGLFSSAATDCLEGLRTGLPLDMLVRESGSVREIDLLMRRLALHGLLEYGIRCTKAATSDSIIIEPQVPGYRPQLKQLDDVDSIVLSRFAYLRRRGDEIVIESPLAGALFRIRDPEVAAFLARLFTPQKVGQLRRQHGFPGVEFLALLLDCQIVFKTDKTVEGNLRMAEGGDSLALWDFHDLLFHARSTEGRHANPVGGVYPHGGLIPPLPALRPGWPGKRIDLCTFLTPQPEALSFAKLLRDRHSTRLFDNGKPITLAELSRFLDGSARVLSRPQGDASDEDGPEVARPYPSAGGRYELELYIAVNICEGLSPGFYHYDAGAHALTQIEASPKDVKALMAEAAAAMGVPTAPQILINIAARFGRISWKYSSIAYSLILKDSGVLTQTLYLMATDMGLGGCAIGIANIDLFAKMTGLDWCIEGPVGQFALGRGAA